MNIPEEVWVEHICPCLSTMETEGLRLVNSFFDDINERNYLWWIRIQQEEFVIERWNNLEGFCLKCSSYIDIMKIISIVRKRIATTANYVSAYGVPIDFNQLLRHIQLDLQKFDIYIDFSETFVTDIELLKHVYVIGGYKFYVTSYNNMLHQLMPESQEGSYVEKKDNAGVNFYSIIHVPIKGNVSGVPKRHGQGTVRIVLNGEVLIEAASVWENDVIVDGMELSTIQTNVKSLSLVKTLTTIPVRRIESTTFTERRMKIVIQWLFNTDDVSIMDGIYKTTYPNGDYEQDTYRFGKKHGQSHYKMPRYESIGRFENDKKVGQWITTYPDGEKRYFKYVDDKLNGTSMITKPGNLRLIFRANDGLINGPAIEYIGDGRIIKFSFVDGRRVGPATLGNERGLLVPTWNGTAMYRNGILFDSENNQIDIQPVFDM